MLIPAMMLLNLILLVIITTLHLKWFSLIETYPLDKVPDLTVPLYKGYFADTLWHLKDPKILIDMEISEKSWNIIRATVMQNSRVQNPALIPQILPSCSSLLAPYSRLKKWVVCENKTGLLGLNVNCSYILTSYWQWFFFSLYFWIKSNLYKLLRSFG